MYSSATTSKPAHAVTQLSAQIRAAPRCGVVLTWYVPIAQTTLSLDDEYGANISRFVPQKCHPQGHNN